MSELDLDRLADYTAGVLGEAEAAEVAALVATDPTWGAAYDELVAADAAVTAMLRADSTGQLEPMPADVVARVDEALGRVAPVPAAAAASAVVVDLDRARTRRRRLFGGVAAAAAAAVVAVGGVGFVASGLSQQDSATSANEPAMSSDRSGGQSETAGTPPPSAMAPDVAAKNAVRVVASGTDYDASTLGSFGAASGSTADAVEVIPGSQLANPGGPAAEELYERVTGSLPGLSRLTDRSALFTCLSMVIAEYPGRVAAVDYATYRGQPALIVRVQQANGAVVAAAGANCGISGADVQDVATG